MSDLLTVRDVAQCLQVSEDKVIRLFARVDGVIDLGRPENINRRRYRVLRIPKAVVERYLTTKAGRSIHIEVPKRAERRRKSPRWENRAVLNLAKAGLQNEADKKAYLRIAEKARVLQSHVPERRWVEAVNDGWWDNDD
jgi:hypothetical protein